MGGPFVPVMRQIDRNTGHRETMEILPVSS